MPDPVPNLLTTNHTTGRGGHRPDAIVVHVMVGTMAGTLSHFRNPRSKVSAHYGVSLLGNAVQYVRDEDAAWANGLAVSPTAQVVREREGINPNLYTLSIECEGTGREPLTPLQRGAVVALIRTLAARHGIPITRRHVLRHDEIRADKACPGAVDVDELVELAAGPAPQVVPEPLTVTALPPHLARITVPRPHHIGELVKAHGLSADVAAAGLAVGLAYLRAIVHHEPVTLGTAADALADWLEERL